MSSTKNGSSASTTTLSSIASMLRTKPMNTRWSLWTSQNHRHFQEVHSCHDGRVHQIRGASRTPRKGGSHSYLGHLLKVDLSLRAPLGVDHGSRQRICKQDVRRTIYLATDEASDYLGSTSAVQQSGGEIQQTIAKYLNSFVNSTTLDWELYLAPLILCYNTSFHRSVQNTPYFLTYGMEPDYHRSLDRMQEGFSTVNRQRTTFFSDLPWLVNWQWKATSRPLKRRRNITTERQNPKPIV
jgi:hypothetical protein